MTPEEGNEKQESSRKIRRVGKYVCHALGLIHVIEVPFSACLRHEKALVTQWCVCVYVCDVSPKMPERDQAKINKICTIYVNSLDNVHKRLEGLQTMCSS